ncbi:MAG: tRNA pseudouridine(38-40) synthase TruA [Firmicutes bacterium]|nr:tRNA pseudouridine(38-40) synthase TruA [Bacillota bacterium]
MKNIRLTIEYDGTEYVGWQRQLNGLSIQQVVEESIKKVTGEVTVIYGSGRTDGGVHARGQVANFITNSTIPPERFSYALNSVLPADIKIIQSIEVDMEFHSRYSATGKGYKYSMVVCPHGVAIGSNYYYHVRPPLDIDAMIIAANYFKGTHDFSAFQAFGSSINTTVRTIYEADIKWDIPYLYFTVKGNGFLYNMVRVMVGTLIKVGKRRILPTDIPIILASKDRLKAGPTAQAKGLSLEEVYYE